MLFDFRRILSVLFTAVLLLVGLSAFGANPLTFEERVAAQEAIERVQYEQRIWPDVNPGPKPPFEEVMPRSVLEAKVTDYLKKSAALDAYWRRPLTAGQLQAEMDRMARNTQAPDVLRKLFQALDDDPRLIAECLARPVLADRLIRNWYAFDDRFHGDLEREARELHAMLTPENFEALGGQRCRPVRAEQSDSGMPSPPPDELKTLALDRDELADLAQTFPPPGKISPVKETREAFTVRFTERSTEQNLMGAEITFPKTSFDDWWGAASAAMNWNMRQVRRGSFQLPAIAAGLRAARGGNSWLDSPALTFPCPRGRLRHTAVWTGSEMIIWGGDDGDDWYWTNTGGRYSPDMDTWNPTSTGEGCPTGRQHHTAVWTGTEMIIWGGTAGDNSGGRYDPATDIWSPTFTGTSCPVRRSQHTAIWTGTEMIVWGGGDSLSYSDGGRYNPDDDTWIATSTGDHCPIRRYGHTAVWTGSEMIVWGGYGSGSENSGGRYNPDTDTWLETSTGDGCPQARDSHTAVWTGAKMIIWGGDFRNDGGVYDPQTDSWMSTSTGSGCPWGGSDHCAVWTGEEMIIWGAGTDDGKGVGGRYDPLTDTWEATSTEEGCPTSRSYPTAVWTGAEMIVWGGDYSDCLYTGGRYDPWTDTWVPTSTGAGCPDSRENPTAIWTGTELIVWGGRNGAQLWDTGGRYDPVTDIWTPTRTGGDCPSERTDHTAVWTGTKMVVWGGVGSDSYLSDGGRYNPSTDNWKPTATGGNCPEARTGHSAVWTGDHMIIWGGRINGPYLDTGGLYDPSSNVWTVTATGAECPAARVLHTAIWTGTEMVVWGGYVSGRATATATGGRYHPSLDQWEPTSTGEGCPSKRKYHSAVWTGDEMVVWGGADESGRTNSGARYDPVFDSWVPMSVEPDTPIGRIRHKAVWTGESMIVWGGIGSEPYSSTDLQSGGVHYPAKDAWTATTTKGKCPSARSMHCAVWTGQEMIVWGGSDDNGRLHNGGAYDPPDEPPCSLTCSADANPGTGYSPLPVAFFASVEGEDCQEVPSFAWDFGDGATSSEQNPSHTYETVGEFTWILTSTADDASCTQMGTVSVEPLICLVVCQATVPLAGSVHQEIAFDGNHESTNCTAPPEFLWTFGDGSSADTEDSSHTFDEDGQYDWTFTVTVDGVICNDSGTIFVGVNIPGDADGDGTVSIGEVQQVINMFLGTLPPGNGADCDGNGQISIGEVQKVINAFLGEVVHC